MILAIDTSGALATVAVHDGSAVVFSGVGTRPRAHGEELGPLLREAMSGREARLTHVVVGRGPGLYTGLRVGLVAARVVAWALNRPLLGFCSLDVLADQLHPGLGECLVVVDARRNELFWARYRDGRRIAGPEVDGPGRVLAITDSRTTVVGDTRLLAADGGTVGSTRMDPVALGCFAAELVASGAGEPTTPLYLRSPDVTSAASSGSAPGTGNR